MWNMFAEAESAFPENELNSSFIKFSWLEDLYFKMIQFSCPPFFTQGITSLRWQLVNIKLYSFRNLFKSTFSTYAFCGLAVNSRNKTFRKIFRKNDRNCKLTISFLKISISMLQTYIKGKRGIYICVDNRNIRLFFNISKRAR